MPAFLFQRNNKLIISIEEMKKNFVSPFIEMIWEIISDPVSDNIISWTTNGTSFSITDPALFAHDILTSKFKHGNISSFVRQLNMYNFHKNKANTKDLQFHHKLFRRDARDLLIGIKRKPSEADQQEGQELLRKFLRGQEKTSMPISPSKTEVCEGADHPKEESTSSPLFSPEIFFLPQMPIIPQPRKISSSMTSYQNFSPSFKTCRSPQSPKNTLKDLQTLCFYTNFSQKKQETETPKQIRKIPNIILIPQPEVQDN